jgi:hypothetical protein
MPAKPLPNRRTNERRVDKITMKARTMVGTLKRTIGTSAARRFLEKNGHGADLVQDMMISSVERRCSSRRADGYTVRTKPQRANPQPMRKADISGPLGAEELQALYQLRSANDSENVFIRVCDCPPQFVRFGFMEPGPRGARITERGRATLLHWTRARALLAVSRGQGIAAFENSIETWLYLNRFIERSGTEVVITARGAEWLETCQRTLDEIG